MSLFTQLASQEIPYFGYNLSGLPLRGELALSRQVEADENINSECDPLVPIDGQLLTRPMYFDRGWTNDKRLFIRKPALLHLQEYDSFLHQFFGWRVRVADPFRPWKVQQKGFQWGVGEVCKGLHEISEKEFLQTLQKAVQSGAPTKILKLLERYVWEADIFFSYVQPLPYNPKDFPKNVSHELITAAATLELIDLRLDPYAVNAHGSGGIADIEFVTKEGKLVNVGVPVDQQGPESFFAFFEERAIPLLEIEFKKRKLSSVKARQNYYRKAVQSKNTLQEFLKSCGVDVKKFLTSEKYFFQTWEEIKSNRRILAHVAQRIGLWFDGWESWHVACNDARGGVRSCAKGIVSGAGDYAVFLGQKQCAWGNATKLWEQYSVNS